MKNYLIIGCSTGIGNAIFNRLGQHHHVIGTYYKNQPESTPTNSTIHYLNVLEESSEFSFIPEKLDGLIYCPGSIQLKPFHRFKEDDFIKDYQLQVIGAVKVIQASLAALKKSEQASIVLFSTVAVQNGFSFHSLVSSSKGAIEGLTRALSAELAPKIRVNCIAPSITDTPLAQSILSTPEKREANAQRHPLKAIGSPEDIANAALFLLGEESKWMTGQVLHLDGGIGTIR
ncbi:SDR family NAD(P)-dependent oxidoreductase [Algoriphagus sp. PAP.12]|uniref:SDR family NAD(P)-dependent oxidoreductase n=1 Tax=Algoriphagus sp. PAP.12 TaxID=2996678 RepID=UPI00227D6408|nr:SDR family oxidoreductase [Algoriphagus sp. PAP.12]